MSLSSIINHKDALELLHKSTPGHILEHYNEPYNLDPSKLDEYAENGFVIVENVLNEDALDYAQHVVSAAVVVRKEHDKRALAEKSQYEQSFLQCGYLCWDYPAIKDLVFGKRFALLARDLLKGKAVRLWHDQALFKEPGGRQTDVHIDSSYWPVAEPARTSTLWLALNNVPRKKGSLFFYNKSHKLDQHEYVDIFNNPHLPRELEANTAEIVHTSLSAGDATFHSGLTYHGANANQTDQMRKAMTVIYIDDGVHFDAGDARNATHTSCEGLEHGETIDTKFTPVLA